MPPERLPLVAITFDFWGTLVDATTTPERTAERMQRLHASIVDAGHACTVEEVQAGFRRANRRVSGEAKQTLRDVGPPARWEAVAEELGIRAGVVPFRVIEQIYEEVTLDPPAALMPHVGETLSALREQGYRIGLICNTGMAGGSILRQVLDRHGLLPFFHATTWSNELGWNKPDPRIFQHTLEALGGPPPGGVLHVGDLEDLDVKGALQAGLRAALYAPAGAEPHPPDTTETQAEMLVRSWRDFPAQLRDHGGPPDAPGLRAGGWPSPPHEKNIPLGARGWGSS